MDRIKVISDNEWKGKYSLIEQQHLEDQLPIWSLGDNLETGIRGTVGSGSFFKRKRKDFIKEIPSFKQLSLYEQLKAVYEAYPEEFVANYSSVIQIMKGGAEFLRNSNLPVMLSVSGNREFVYQDLLDLFEKEITGENLDYLELLNSTQKFDLRIEPFTGLEGSTSTLWIPYNTTLNQEAHDYDSHLDEINDHNSERILVLTHENPVPENYGADRAAKMITMIDKYLEGAKKVNQDITLLCGHIDVSGDASEYNGAMVQPISGTETMQYNLETGEYTIESLV
ncbi:hypothetical protein HQ533_05000 [Candidatus Woesearchaeota archaeon]|nr:hypothetical protein [Candidatus Woesearchaeota archaeon]